MNTSKKKNGEWSRASRLQTLAGGHYNRVSNTISPLDSTNGRNSEDTFEDEWKKGSGCGTYKVHNVDITLVLLLFSCRTSYLRQYLRRRKENVRRMKVKWMQLFLYLLIAVNMKASLPWMEIVRHPQAEQVKSLGLNLNKHGNGRQREENEEADKETLRSRVDVFYNTQFWTGSCIGPHTRNALLSPLDIFDYS